MTKRALCIGIDDYGNQSAPEMGMTTLNLHGCVNDAHDWANLLVRNYDFSVGDVSLLTDADATRANILKGIKNLMAGAQRGDVLVLTSSSHGFFTKDVSGDEDEDDTDCGGFTRPPGRYDEAVCPYDYPKLIIDDEFRELFDGIGTGVYLTFIADSCFSGSITDMDLSGKSPQSSQHTYNEILLTGTTDHHMSGDAKVEGRPNGFMSYQAMKAIRDAGYRLTYEELHKNMLTNIENGDSKYKDQNPGLEARDEHKKLYVFTNEFANPTARRDEVGGLKDDGLGKLRSRHSGSAEVNAKANDEVATTLIAMERAALDRWSKGDPSGFLEVSAPDVVFFDPYLDRRIEGREELTRHYERLRGKIWVLSELNDPKVQVIGNSAVLTYHYVFYGENQDKARWNCTEVYLNDGDRWQIIHTHLSVTHTEEDQF